MKMRKVLSAFLALVCLFAALVPCTLGANAAEGTRTVYATNKNDSLKQGSYGYLYVYLDDLTDLSALNLSVYYDAERITVKNVYNKVSSVVSDLATGDGSINASYIFDGKGTATKTNLFYIYYQVNSTAEIGDTYFDIVVNEAYNSSLEGMDFTGSRCSLEIVEKTATKSCSISSSSAVSTSVGEEFELSYRLSTYQIASGSMNIHYDPELFEVVSVTNGGFLTDKIADVNTALDGTVAISFVGTTYRSKYDVVKVRFKTLKNVTETSDIKLVVTDLYDKELNLYSCSGYTTKATVAFDESYTEDAPSMSVSASYDAETGKVTATIKLEKDSMLGAGDFILQFDASRLTLVSAEKGFSPTFFYINDKGVADGVLKFSIVSLEDITDAETLLTLTFDAKQTGEPKTTALALTGSGLTDSLTNPILLNLVNASVTIPRCATVSGTIESLAFDTAPITVELIPEGESIAAYTQTVVGNVAVYTFDGVRAGTYTLKISKANHLAFEETVTVTDVDLTKDASLALGNGEKEFKINSAYLVLTQNIDVIYRTTLPDGFTNPRMVFAFDGKETTINEYSLDENGRYCYAFQNVYPQKMGDNISATLYATVDGTEVSVCIPTYSVRQYCINQLQNDPDEKLRRMISDLLVYGEKTQLYQSYKTDALVTEGLDLCPSTFEPLGTEYNKQEMIGETDENVRYSSARLELKSDLTVLLGISVDDPTPYTFEVTLNGRTETYTASDLVYENGRYYLRYCGVFATQYDDVITAVIKRDGTEIGAALKYSVYTYIQKQQGASDPKLCELLEAIYLYGESAKLFEQ